MAKKSINVSDFLKEVVANDLKTHSNALSFTEAAAWVASALYGLEVKGSTMTALLHNEDGQLWSPTLLGGIDKDQNKHLALEAEYDLATSTVSLTLRGPALPDAPPAAPAEQVSSGLPGASGLAITGLLLLDSALINRGGATASQLGKVVEGQDPSSQATPILDALKKSFPKGAQVSLALAKGDVPQAPSPAQAKGLKALFPRHGQLEPDLAGFTPYTRSSSEPWSPWHKALIPKGTFYESNGQDLQVAELAIAKDLPLLLVGEPGQGKTQLVRYLAEKHQMPLVVLNGHGQMSVEDLLGGMVLKGGNTEVEPAGFTRACEDGCWVLLNEPNAMPEKVQLSLYSLLDDTRMATLGNRVIRVHRDTRFFFTANPVGFRGVRPMTEAMISRMGIKVELPQPTKGQFESVIEKKVPGVAKHIVQAAWKVCEELRKQVHENSLSVTPASFYLRDAIAFCSVAAHLKPLVAFEVTALAAWQNPDERKLVAAAVARHLK